MRIGALSPVTTTDSAEDHIKGPTEKTSSDGATLLASSETNSMATSRPER
jgi:hypothetical protein